MRKRPIINELWQPKNKLGLIVILILLLLLICFSFLIKFGTSNSKAALENFPDQKPQDWRGYLKLEDSWGKIYQTWSHKSPYKKNNLAEKDYIRADLEAQIQEILKISKDDDKIKQSELANNFKDYLQKQNKQFDLEFNKKADLIQKSLETDLKKEKMAIDAQVHDYRRNLEAQQHSNLVNLQLQLVLLDLSTSKEGIQDQKDKIVSEINRIKQENDAKVKAEQKILSDKFNDYEQQRRNEAKSQLEELKTNMEIRRMNNLSEYRAKLDAEYLQWREQQKRNYEKAIQIRQYQKSGYRHQIMDN